MKKFKLELRISRKIAIIIAVGVFLVIIFFGVVLPKLESDSKASKLEKVAFNYYSVQFKAIGGQASKNDFIKYCSQYRDYPGPDPYSLPYNCSVSVKKNIDVVSKTPSEIAQIFESLAKASQSQGMREAKNPFSLTGVSIDSIPNNFNGQPISGYTLYGASAGDCSMAAWYYPWDSNHEIVYSLSCSENFDTPPNSFQVD